MTKQINKVFYNSLERFVKVATSMIEVANTRQQLEKLFDSPMKYIDFINDRMSSGAYNQATYDKMHGIKCELYSIRLKVENKAIEMYTRK